MFMFCVGTAHSAIFLKQALSSMQVATKPSPQTHARYEYIKLTLEVVNCFLGDLIIISTALTLEKIIGRFKPKSRSRSHLAMLYATIPMPATITRIWIRTFVGGVDVLSSVISPVQRGWPSAWISLVLATNLASTLVFVYEFISRWKELKAEHMTVIGGTLKEFFVTLMCSGALYCCTFIVLFVLFSIDSNVRYIVNHMIPQLSGIYPTAAIVIVAFSTNDPSIQLFPIKKQPSRRFHEDGPSTSSVDSSRSIPSQYPREQQSTTLPVSNQPPTPRLCSPRRAFEWCRSKLHRPRPSYPRKGSSYSTATLENSVLVTIEVDRKHDEPYTPKRTTFPLLAPLDADFQGFKNYRLETSAEEHSKRRSIKFASSEEVESGVLGAV